MKNENILILVVDDIISNRLVLSEVIEVLGYQSYCCKNGEEAIEFLLKNEVSLILMDIEMPVMNGIETTIHIRKKLTGPKSKLPIIALTAHNPADFQSEFKTAGFDDLLTKPYLLQNVNNAIVKLLKDEE